MTYDEKKSLYESIMQEVAIQVKRSLNESFNSSIVRKLIEMTKNISKKHPKHTYCLNAMFKCDYLGSAKYTNGLETFNKFGIGEFTDDCFEGDILTGEEAKQLMAQALDDKIGLVYSKDDEGTLYSGTIFAIKLSDKGLEKFEDILKKRKMRRINREADERAESDKEWHRYELKLQQKFNKDQKKAEELGVSIEDYFGMELLVRRLMPEPEFNRGESRSDQIKKNRFEQDYFDFLEDKGIELNREHVRNTILKLLSTLKK